MEELIIKSFGADQIAQMLKEIENHSEVQFVAVHRYRGGVLLYGQKDKNILCNYLDDKGYVVTAYKSIDALKSDLQVMGYYFADISLLKCKLELYELKGIHCPLNRIERRVKGLLDSVELRAVNDRNTAYWAGQRDILEVVSFAIDEIKSGDALQGKYGQD